jgi:hypothetical protein
MRSSTPKASQSWATRKNRPLSSSCNAALTAETSSNDHADVIGRSR